MTTPQAIAILSAMNKWKKSIKPFDNLSFNPPYSEKELSVAIDKAIEVMIKYKSK